MTMITPARSEAALAPAGAPLPPALAGALSAEIPDAVVGRWPGGSVWLPCGHPSAVTGANLFHLTPGRRADLPLDIEIDLPVGTLIAQGTFTPMGTPTQVRLPQRCALVLPEPESIAAIAPEPTGMDIFAAGMESLAALLEFEVVRPGRLACITTALDRSVLIELLAFFEEVYEGLLAPDERRLVARASRQMVLCRWPLASAETQRTLRALNLLASVARRPDDVPAPGSRDDEVPNPQSGRLNELQLTLASVRSDPGLRPRLWNVLHRSTVHLVVPSYELEPGREARLSLLGSEVQGVRHTFGFTSAERLDAVLDERTSQMVSVEVTGEELSRFWPADQWLVLDPGEPTAIVLEPAEVRSLPYGPRHGVPAAFEVVTPEFDPERDGHLAAIGLAAEAVCSIRVAVLVDKASGSTQTVAAVAVPDEARRAHTRAVMASPASTAGVGDLLLVPDIDANPLAEPLRRDGLLVYRRSVR